jgi:hypothetical protein
LPLRRCMALGGPSLECSFPHQHNVRITDRHRPRPRLFRKANSNR